MERATVESIGVKALSRDQITEILQKEMNTPAFRAKQVIQWL